MSRDIYRSSPGDGRGGQRWDSERFTLERDRTRYGGETRERFEERDSRYYRDGGFGNTRQRERSVGDIYERRGPERGVEEDRYEKRVYYENDEPRYAPERALGRDRGPSVTIEKEREREYYGPSSPARAPARPSFLRRQSSLDTFDRRPVRRIVEREEYGPPARYREDVRPPPLTPIPLPRTRALPPPRRYAERDYEEIKIAEPDFYGDDDFRGYPERVMEREIIRTRRRSRSRESRSHSARSTSRSSSSSGGREARSEFPKRGKTRMPARLVSKKAIIDLGYPFEEEGDTIIIMKALGRENIDEVIRLSEDYKVDAPPVVTTSLTTYVVTPEAEISAARSEASGTVFEERRTQEVFSVPPAPQTLEVVQDTKIVEFRTPSPARSHHHHSGAIILDAGRPREESTFIERKREVVERSDPIPVGPLVLALPPERIRSKDERAIRAEIKALEAEKEALRAEKRADRELRKADRIRRGGRASEGDLILYERDTFERPGEEITLVKRERVVEPDGGVRIEKDRKGRMSISVPKYI